MNIIEYHKYIYISLFNEFEDFRSKAYLQQAMFTTEHFFDGTHKFDEPVSNTTLNDCGGEPNVIGP